MLAVRSLIVVGQNVGKNSRQWAACVLTDRPNAGVTGSRDASQFELQSPRGRTRHGLGGSAGLTVSDRGRISGDVMRQYEAAH